MRSVPDRGAVLAALAALVALGGGAHAQSPGLDAADGLVSSWVDGQRIPGAVLLVLQDGEVALEKAYGWRQRFTFDRGEYGSWGSGRLEPGALKELAEPSPMTVGTVFDLASVTKVMATTFAVMLLVDRGDVSLDAPVSAYLSDFAGGGKEAITVRHILTHRSGLLQWVPTYYHADDDDRAYAYLRDLPLGWSVGEARHYSDLGFMVLGRLVEKVSGRSLDDFLRDELYRPLGLVVTGFRPAGRAAGPVGPWGYAATSHGNPYEHHMVHDSTFGYRIDGDPNAWNGWRRYTLVGEVNDGNAWHTFRGVAGHAGLFSSARELGVLLQLLLNHGAYGGRQYLSPRTIETFLASTGDEQALGWRAPDYAPEGSFAHTGFTGTYVLGVPARSLAVVLLTNRQNLGVDARGLYADVSPLQRGVAEAILGAESR